MSEDQVLHVAHFVPVICLWSLQMPDKQGIEAIIVAQGTLLYLSPLPSLV